MDAPSRQDVERQLRLLLSAPEFAASPKLSELLYYLVTEALEGNGERLKGYTIGLDVFAREPGFDQGGDAIVRVQMGRLRKLLTAYYHGSGASDPIRIVLVRGRYVPRFELASGEVLPEVGGREAPPAEAIAAAEPEAEAAGKWRKLLFARPSPRGMALLGALAVMTGVALVLAVLLRPFPQAPETALSRPQGPLVYVAQYRVIASDPLAHQLANGLQYDLVNQLAKFPEIAVLGLESVNGIGPTEAEANPKGANFVLGGAIEIAGQSVRITSQLKRTRDGLIIWSDQATADSLRPMTIIKIQAQIAATVASKLGQSYGVISQAMADEVNNRADPSLADYQCVLSAYAYMRHKTAEQHLAVRSCLEQTVAKSPNYSTAWALLSWVYGDEERYGFNPRPSGDALRRALRAAERAVAADSNSATAHEYLSVARFLIGTDDAGAREAAATALRLSPNNSEVLADAAWSAALLDGDERSRQLVLKAIELNPGHPAWYWGPLTIHALQNGLKDDALKYARLNISDRGPMEMFLTAAALRVNGQDAAADQTLAALRKAHPETNDRAHMMRVLRIPPKIERLIFGN